MEQKIAEELQITDKVGLDTLDVISDANRFNEWMYKTVAKHTSGEILEIGSGIGNISNYFSKNNASISVSDLREEYCNILRKKKVEGNNFKNIYQIDIIDPDFDKKHSNLFGKFDSVFALNIVEHIEDDTLAIRNCLKFLKKGGKLVILVPAFMYLFNSFDIELGHLRRYNRKKLEKLFTQNKAIINGGQYFNSIGILGWWLNGNILKKKNLPSGQMKLYDSLVWFFKIIDFFTRRIAGLSVIVVGEKV